MQFPLSQRRHTNVAVVRYTKNGVKLEIACYKNKVISYRSGIEDRLDEVLQVGRIFTNVGRGLVASKKDIQTVFSEEMTQDKCIKYILDHGELQVAHQERTAEIDELFKDIAVIISHKCVHKENGRPFPTPVIEQSLRSIGAAVKQDQPVKKQALFLIQQLIESQIIPITRAKMKVRCSTVSNEALHQLELWCVEHGAVVLEKSDTSTSPSSTDQANGLGPSSEVKEADSLITEDSATGASQRLPVSALILLPPHLLRLLDVCVKQQLPAGSTLDMVDPAVMEASGVADAATIVGSVADGSTVNALPLGSSPHSMHSFSSSPPSSHTTQGKENFTEHSRGHKGTYSDDDDSIDDDDECQTKKKTKNNKKKRDSSKESDAEQNKKAKNRGPARKDLLSSALQLDLGDDSDEDSNSDAWKKARKGKKKRKAGGAQKPSENASSHPASVPEEEEDSDAEVEGNRRQRKKLNKKAEGQQFHSLDDEFFDYGDEEDGE